ncbi:PITH domain-containing protein GA19395-like [Pollicipes pollicipes]|uniref:PITH domain-containing protein GA19395-like n=1 Tax=Pollicipes pollicipes TaxID=41117 RepID=UPI0018858C98|nr:PITH domain-containing protein GA19395-like [Pollicipes pollicipes]XP_037085190.1 PITH domain-containing protein GA19395-like [Pollicipes pollicipes]XP_037085192.1 PITH domain-containing protein GA19395-like [Pollicipes pollicipes]XP_037085465.1 PITH domain-containing protein GA19395-like [Pollicipes pollicipes]XP_037085466.1 PITH domain-containing protein GA19395-like [Pollicipes pollicipes]
MGGHDHHHGGDCEHENNGIDPSEMGIMYSLYQKIDIDHVVCLNEEEEDSGKHVFKAWEDRLDKEKFVDSDADEELLFNIPFTGNIKLKGLILIGGEEGTHPSKIRLYKNRQHMTFDDMALACDQEFELHRDPEGKLEYNTKVVTFSSVHHLTIHIPGNMGGGELTRLYYLGLRGEFSPAHRHGVTICNYELRPNAADLKDKSLHETANQQVQ